MESDLIKRQILDLPRWGNWSLTLFLASTLGLVGVTACQSTVPSPASSPVAQVPAAQPAAVTLKTADGWTILGDRYQPMGKAKGAVVLLHQRGGTAQDWQMLSTALVKAGFIALALDQRGAGRSTQGPGPTGQDAPWQTGGDIDAAIASLPKGLPVGLAGASYGANNALIYAAAHPQKLKGLALFSPGANYNGLDALGAARKNRTAFVIYHGENDSISGDGPQQIDRLTPASKHRLEILKSANHGTDLLSAETVQETVKFFAEG